LCPNEGSGVKLSIWLPTTTSQRIAQFPCVQVAWNILLENFQQGLKICFKLHLNWRYAHKVIGLQSYRGFNFGNFGILTLELKIKWHLSVGHVAKHREYYKGEGGGFPLIWAVMSLVNPCLFVVHSCTKSALTMH